MTKWNDLIKAFFGLALSDAEVEVWESEINRKFNEIDSERICFAIRWASDERNYHRDKMQGKPTVQELIKWLGISAWKSRQDNMPNAVCYMCDGSGWIPWSRDLGDNREFTLEEYNMSITTVIPCGCSVGRHVFEATYGAGNKRHNAPVDGNAQMTVARQAARQRQRYANLHN